MTAVSVSLHRVVKATAVAQRTGSTSWVDLTFTDEQGQQLNVTLYTAKPEELLRSLTGEEATS